MNDYDCIIIGGGVAALTGALYLGRYQRKAILLADVIGGQTAIAGSIENYPGFESINGSELILKIKSQVLKLENITIKEGARVNLVERSNDHFTVKVVGKEYQTKAVLIAAGKQHRKLGLGSEDSLVGKGLSYCATCDGAFAKGKDVAVIGGGNSAVEAVNILSSLANKIYLVVLDNKLTGETIKVKKVENNPKVEILYQHKTTELLIKDGLLTGFKYKASQGNEGSKTSQMIFVEIGWVPNSEKFAKIVNLNKELEIIIDPKTNQTSQRGIFAAGDITDVPAKQTIIACSEGAKAAIAINKYLENLD